MRFTYNYNRLQSNVAFPRTDVAAVVGGVVGGVTGLLAPLCLAFFCFRRRRRQHLQTLNERPNPLLLPQPEAMFTGAGAAGVDLFASSAAPSASRPSGTSRPLQSWTDSEVGFAANPANRDASYPSPGVAAAAAAPQDQDASTPTRPATTAVPAGYRNGKSRLAPGGGTPQQGPTASLDVPSARPNTVLTDDQADFVNSLFNSGVPAPVVARVLERMLTNPQGASSTGFNDPELRPHLNPGNLSTLSHSQAPAGGVPWQLTLSDIGDEETILGTAPPSYDHAQAQ